MTKRLLVFLFSLTLSFVFLSNTSSALAAEPFAPFSVEGNPPEEYYWEKFFPLFRYVRPAALKVFENMDRARKYAPLEICKTGKGGQLADRRDQECDNLRDECTGGPVDLCDKNSGTFDHTAISQNGSCSATDKDPPGTTGTCSYTRKPTIKRDVKGTDFSADSTTPNASTPDSENESTTALSTLNYPKLQTEHNLQQNIGNDNALTWGVQYLSNNQCEINTRKLLTVFRAGQTKATLRETGEWPLGWVDWGYITPNGKTLLQIGNELPGPLSGTAMGLADKLDHYYRNGLHPEEIDTARDREFICTYLGKEAEKPEASRGEWFKDLLQAPIYPPSFRQGYVRASICVWNDCCPGLNCPFPGVPMGKSLTLYYDISVSSAFNAAFDEIQATFPGDYGQEYIRNIAITNPLIRFAMSADKEATPTKIIQRFETEFGNNNCLPYLPKIPKFTITWFGTVMDHVLPNTFIGPGNTCPSYRIMPEMSKEKAAAFPQTLLSTIIDFFWAKRVDDVDLVREHLITIPEVMGQSITELSQDNYNIQDTVADLFAVKEFNSNLSNVIDDSADLLYVGKTSDPQAARRNLALFSCTDPYFSSQTETSIESYALGTRVGCSEDLGPGICDGKKFGEILANNPKNYPTTVMSSTDSFIKSKILPKFTPEMLKTYALVEKETGVPCEVLAAHHFEEGSSSFTDGGDPSQVSAANGQPLEGGESLLDTVKLSAKAVLHHPFNSVDKLVEDMSDFNGGGNSNCQAGFPGGTIPYGGCPRMFIGDDDPYATNLLDSRHQNMYLLYCGDFTPCIPPKPYGNDRPGAYAVALSLYNNMTKNGNSGFKDAKPVTSPVGTPTGEKIIFKPETCGENTLATALGCLPYDQRFTGVLLSFVAGISGAISLVVMLMGVFQIMTAGADPEKLKKGKELFTGAIIGLLFVIFSVTLLKIIAGDIIKLPGF